MNRMSVAPVPGLIAMALLFLCGPAEAASAAPFTDAAVSWDELAAPMRHADVTLAPRTKALSIALRLRVDAVGWRGSLVSHRVAGARTPTFELSANSSQLRFVMKTSDSKEPLALAVPLEAVGRTGWHDVAVRYSGPRVDLFVDGVWVDEDFPVGELVIPAGTLRLGDRDATRSFRGEVQHLGVWTRALSDQELTDLAGGGERVAAATLAINGRLFGAPNRPLQYWRPGHFNVGDTFPFFDGTIFRFLYLRDKNHHHSKNDLGAHQWAQATSTDLVNWRHLPTPVGITDESEASICTGSLFKHGETFYAFYAKRQLDWNERVTVATSRDGVRFEKKPLSLSAPAGYKKSFRDPNVFADPKTGVFHMWVTAEQEKAGGTLVHLTSKDLENWAAAEPIVMGGDPPECTDHFSWKGWHYLVYSQGLRARYRMSRQPFGPWQTPEVEGLGDDALKVMKTASFTGDRRIGTAWINDQKWGGRAVFRELVQQADGTLGTAFVAEMIPATDRRLSLSPAPRKGGGQIIRGVPRDARVRLSVQPDAQAEEAVLWLRGGDGQATGIPLVLDGRKGTVRLGDRVMTNVVGIDRGIALDIVLTGDIVDVSVGGRRTIIVEGDLHAGTTLAVSGARIANLDVRPLK